MPNSNTELQVIPWQFSLADPDCHGRRRKVPYGISNMGNEEKIDN